MKRTFLLLVLCACAATSAHAGDEPILPRFKALESPGVKLVRALGAGELPGVFTRVSDIAADEKTAVYVDFVGVTDEKPGDTRLLLWDVEAGRFRKEILVPGHVTALALSANGARLLVGTLSEDAKKQTTHTIAEWDAVTGKSVRMLGQHKDPVFTVAYSAKQDQALSACWREVKTWGLSKGTLPKEVRFPDGSELFTAAFVPGSDKVLCVVNRSLRLIDLGEKDSKKAAKGLFELTEHKDIIVGLAISPDGKLAVSSSRDGSVRSWDLAKGKPLHELKKNFAAGQSWISLALAEDGKTVLSCWSDSGSETGSALISLWDASTGKEHWSNPGNYRGTVPIRIRGKHALVGGGCNALSQWDLVKGTVERTWGGHKSAVSAILADSTERLYSAGHDGNVHVWVKGQLVRSFAAHAEPIVAMTLHPRQTRLFTASADKTVKIWDVITGKLQQTLTGHTGSVSAIVVGKDGKRAYTASSDRSIKIWDLDTGKALATLTGHADAVNAVALSRGESWLATGSDDTTIRVWPIKNDKLDPDREIILLEQHKKAVTCLTFATDGKTLLSGSQDTTLKVWDWAKGKVSRTLTGHKNWISSLAFVDASTVLTTSDDLSLCRWNLETGKETGRIDFGVIGDCPRCLARLAPDRFVVGTSSWMLFEFDTGKR